MLLWFLFGVSGLVSKVLKMRVFPIFWAVVGWFLLVYLDLEGLGVLCFLRLALNPHFFVFCFLFFVFCFFICFLFCFSFWVSNRKTVFPLKKGIFCLFLSVSLCFSLAFFGPPPFSLSLFLSLSCSFLSSFLPVFHFFFLVLVFLFV